MGGRRVPQAARGSPIRKRLIRLGRELRPADLAPPAGGTSARHVDVDGIPSEELDDGSVSLVEAISARSDLPNDDDNFVLIVR